MRKKLLAICMVLLVLTAALSADVPYSISLSGGIRIDEMSPQPMIYAFEASIGDAALLLQNQAGGSIDGGLSYAFHQGKTVLHTIDLYTSYVPKEGGWSGTSYAFSQDFKWGVFTFGYLVGLQLGLSYSPYSSILFWALTPLVSLNMGIATEHFSLSLFAAVNDYLDRAWKFRPYCGCMLEYHADQHHTFFVEGHMRFAEFLIDRVFTLESYDVRIGYRYQTK